MKTELLHVGMQVRHPQYGIGTVKSVAVGTTDVQFNEGLKTIAPETSELQPADALANISGLEMPLRQLIREIGRSVIDELGLEKPEGAIQELAVRWHKGNLVLHPADHTLQTKEIPLDVFFHKIVMLRNNLRVLEQKINGHKVLTDGEKFDIQQYITRCYGSMTTFNILFKEKENQFSSK